MSLLMQRLLQEMADVQDVSFAEPDSAPESEEIFIGLMPMAIRRMVAVLQRHLDELHDEVRWHVLGNHSTNENKIDRLRRYVDFIMETLMHELEELMPEVATFRRQGALITFRRKWQVCALEQALRSDKGTPIDVIATLVGETILNENDPKDGFDLLSDNDQSADSGHEDDEDIPPNKNLIGNLGGAEGSDLSWQMDQIGWLDRAANIVQGCRNKTQKPEE
ncbi:hypothetical protein KKF05_03400 [Patescibacteria group bacterium]|nr:hypothetical protein [Patescibacteria group bacterium]MBU1029433.1 hypothetical protein [Patescibacteria group bacterium]